MAVVSGKLLQRKIADTPKAYCQRPCIPVCTSTYQYIPSTDPVQTKYILVYTCKRFEIASTNMYELSWHGAARVHTQV